MSIGLAVFCLPWLRWKHPEWERPIKVSLIWPVLYILATIFITIVPMVASPVETGKSSFHSLISAKDFKAFSGLTDADKLNQQVLSILYVSNC